ASIVRHRRKGMLTTDIYKLQGTSLARESLDPMQGRNLPARASYPLRDGEIVVRMLSGKFTPEIHAVHAGRNRRAFLPLPNTNPNVRAIQPPAVAVGRTYLTRRLRLRVQPKKEKE